MKTKFVVEKITAKSAILRKGVEYTAAVPMKKIYQKISEGMEIVGSKTLEDGSVSITFKIKVKSRNNELLERTEMFTSDYCKGGRVLGKNINGALYSYLSDEELFWSEGEKPFIVEIDRDAIKNWLDKKHDLTQWTEEDL